MKDWYLLQDPETLWLVDGLFPADGDSAIAGRRRTKPKNRKFDSKNRPVTTTCFPTLGADRATESQGSQEWCEA